MAIRNRLSAVMLLCCGSVYSAEQPTFRTPAFLSGPTISRAAYGNTYSYRGGHEFPDLALQITISEIPTHLPRADTAVCRAAFLTELRRADPKLFVEPESFNLLGRDLTFDAQRWTQTRERELLTGIVACAIHQNRFVAINFQDDVRAAPQSFTAIRTALTNLTLP